MAKQFGTDGIRGKAAEFTTELLAGVVQGLLDYHSARTATPPRIFLSGDTRESTEQILSTLSQLLAAQGIEHTNAGVLPTPAINHVFYTQDYDYAIDITASHNPYPDNGLKIFERGDGFGVKLGSQGRTAIESALMSSETTPVATPVSSPAQQNALQSSENPAGPTPVTPLSIYRDFITDYLGSVDFSGLKVGFDFANGATSVFRDFLLQLFPEAETINYDQAYGRKINQNCGSTHLEQLTALVKTKHLDLGAAFDGDGDRCLLIDANGDTVDGDQVLPILAQHFGLNAFAATVMANQGLLEYCKNHNINLEITPVGDQHVFAAMQEKGLQLGGEQSGHIILPGQPMGDGILTALTVIKAVTTSGRTLTELANMMPRFPQTTLNVPATADEKSRLDTPAAQQLITAAEQELAPIHGRLLVRPSGTEELIRITLWGEDAETIDQLAHRLAADLTKAIKKENI